MLIFDDPVPQFVVLAGLVAIAIIVAVTPKLRHVIAWLIGAGLKTIRLISAGAVRVFDLILPVNARDGRVSIRALCLWGLVNLGTIVGWVFLSALRGDASWQNAAAMACASFLALNLLFLAGAYWALKEGIDIMNGDKAYVRRQFSDLSTAKNVVVVCLWFAITILQTAAVLQWLQEHYGVALISIHGSLGLAYFDHLLAVVGALPLISFLAGASEVAERVAFEPGWGSFCSKAINSFGSILIVSTILGFVQQHIALRSMIERLLVQTNPGTFAALLRWRLLRAPSVIKRYLRQAFQAETNDERRLKLLQLAVDRHSFSVPGYFIRSYAGLSDAVKEGGARIIADFTAKQAHRLDAETTLEICSAARLAFATKALPTRDHTRRIGEIILPCIERLTLEDQTDKAFHRRGLQIVRQKPIRMMLGALLHEHSTEPLRKRAAELLIRAKAQDSLPELVHCLQYMDDPLRLPVLQGARRIVEDRGINFSDGDKINALSDMVRTIDWLRKALEFRGAAITELQGLRDAVVRRQRA